MSAVIIDFYRPVRPDGRLAIEMVLQVAGLTQREISELELNVASCHMTLGTMANLGYQLLSCTGHNPVLEPYHTRTLVFVKSSDQNQVDSD